MTSDTPQGAKEEPPGSSQDSSQPGGGNPPVSSAGSSGTVPPGAAPPSETTPSGGVLPGTTPVGGVPVSRLAQAMPIPEATLNGLAYGDISQNLGTQADTQSESSTWSRSKRREPVCRISMEQMKQIIDPQSRDKLTEDQLMLLYQAGSKMADIASIATQRELYRDMNQRLVDPEARRAFCLSPSLPVVDAHTGRTIEAMLAPGGVNVDGYTPTAVDEAIYRYNRERELSLRGSPLLMDYLPPTTTTVAGTITHSPSTVAAAYAPPGGHNRVQLAAGPQPMQRIHYTVPPPPATYDPLASGAFAPISSLTTAPALGQTYSMAPTTDHRLPAPIPRNNRSDALKNRGNNINPQITKAQKDTKFPPYSGKTGDFYAWQKQIRDLVNFKELGPFEAGKLLRLALHGAARTFIVRKDPTASWSDDQILHALGEEFEWDDPATAIAYLQQTPMRSGESVADYLRRIEDVYERTMSDAPGDDYLKSKTLIGIAMNRLPEPVLLRLDAEDIGLPYSEFRRKVFREMKYLAATSGKYPRKADVGITSNKVQASSAAPRRAGGGVMKNKVSFGGTVNALTTQEFGDVCDDVEKKLGERIEKIVTAKMADVTNAFDAMQRETRESLGQYRDRDDPEEFQPRSRSPSPGACFYCKKPGHMARDCPKAKKRFGQNRPNKGTQSAPTNYGAIYAASASEGEGDPDPLSDVEEADYEPVHWNHPLSDASIKAEGREESNATLGAMTSFTSPMTGECWAMKGVGSFGALDPEKESEGEVEQATFPQKGDVNGVAPSEVEESLTDKLPDGKIKGVEHGADDSK